MSTTVDIPGGRAVLRENKEVKQRDRRRREMALVKAAPAFAKMPKGRDPQSVGLAELGLTPEEHDAIYEVQNATILAVLVSWDLRWADGSPRPLPQTGEDLDDLETELYDALSSATQRSGADALAPVDFSPSPDPTPPTVESGVSETPSTAAPESVSIPTSPSGGESSPTGAPLAA